MHNVIDEYVLNIQGCKSKDQTLLLPSCCCPVIILVLSVQELDELKISHGQLQGVHSQLQETHQELTQQQKLQAESNSHADLVSELNHQLQQARQDMAGQRAKTMALQQVNLQGLRHRQE